MMYNNIGKKIKRLSVFLAWCGITCGFIYAFTILFSKYNEYGATKAILITVGIIIASIILSWILSWFLYGFGQLIDNTDKLVKYSRREALEPIDIPKIENNKNQDYYNEDEDKIPDTVFPKTKQEMLISQLTNLKDLYESGKISTEKFKREKQEILNKYNK